MSIFQYYTFFYYYEDRGELYSGTFTDVLNFKNPQERLSDFFSSSDSEVKLYALIPSYHEFSKDLIEKTREQMELFLAPKYEELATAKKSNRKPRKKKVANK